MLDIQSRFFDYLEEVCPEVERHHRESKCA